MDKVTSSNIDIVCDATNAARKGRCINDCPYAGANREIWIEAFLSVVAARLHQMFPRSIVVVSAI